MGRHPSTRREVRNDPPAQPADPRYAQQPAEPTEFETQTEPAEES